MAVAEGWNYPEKRHSKSLKVIVEVSRGGDGCVCVCVENPWDHLEGWVGWVRQGEELLLPEGCRMEEPRTGWIPVGPRIRSGRNKEMKKAFK